MANWLDLHLGRAGEALQDFMRQARIHGLAQEILVAFEKSEV
jgi:hypothetical protein